MGMRKVSVELGALFIYSLRVGYLKYWFKGVADAMRKLSLVVKEREVLSGRALETYRKLEAANPGFWYMLKKRVFQNRVRI